MKGNQYYYKKKICKKERDRIHFGWGFFLTLETLEKLLFHRRWFILNQIEIIVKKII